MWLQLRSWRPRPNKREIVSDALLPNRCDMSQDQTNRYVETIYNKRTDQCALCIYLWRETLQVVQQQCIHDKEPISVWSMFKPGKITQDMFTFTLPELYQFTMVKKHLLQCAGVTVFNASYPNLFKVICVSIHRRLLFRTIPVQLYLQA